MVQNDLKPGKINYKRKQIIDYIINEIEAGKLEVGSSISSLNELKEHFGVARNSIVSAYSELKAMGIIKSIPRKGFCVVTSKNIVKHRIFLFLDALNGYKSVLYESFKEGIGRRGTVDVFFHHFNTAVFENLITQNLGSYTSFVIMPTTLKNCGKVLKTIPEGKLYILDLGRIPYGKKYPSVCQNFGKNYTDCLNQAKDLLAKYNKIILVHPNEMEPDIFEAFFRFGKEQNIPCERIRYTDKCNPVKGECYIAILDEDLANVIKASTKAKLEIGKDIGILSYNDAPLKEVLAGGITLMSTDFRKMGLTMADMVLNRKSNHIECPCYFIERHSL